MKEYIKERTLEIACYILENKTTIRSAAKIFDLSKSTVHYDLSTRLPKIDGKLFDSVKEILEQNFSEKHIRGGESTKKRYLKNAV